MRRTSPCKLKSGWTAFEEDSKKCSGEGIEWVSLVQPKWMIYPNLNHDGGGVQESSDIKPVVEHIEDDLKYDFRTKTHSF